MEYDIQNIDGQRHYVPKDPQVVPPMPAAASPCAPSVLQRSRGTAGVGGNPFAVSPWRGGPHADHARHVARSGLRRAPAQNDSVDEQRRVGQDYPLP